MLNITSILHQLNEVLTGLPKEKQRLLRKKLKRLSTGGGVKSVLEIGAGSGLITYFLAAKLDYQDYLVSDYSAQMLKKAKDRLSTQYYAKKLEFREIDLMNMESVTKKFDLILGVDIIHHISDPKKVFIGLKKLLSENGKLVLLETNIYNPLTWLNIIGNEHEIRAVLNTPKNFNNWLNEAGFIKVKITPTPTFTPSGPKTLGKLLGFIDKLLIRIPKLKKICALWLIEAQ
jgi:2-polyprenyl-3-methyl-5-hydroxy-6-metoxy-1,4-benzoquinol methylase